MKNMKKAVSFLLVFAMVLVMNSATAFAAEFNTILSDENIATTDGNAGIMPLIYDDKNWIDIPAKGTVTLSGFSIPDRYMGVEARAIVKGGGTTNGIFTLYVLDHGANMCSKDISIDGSYGKIDWIDFKATNNSFGFKIVNNSNVDINIHIIYYSWS